MIEDWKMKMKHKGLVEQLLKRIKYIIDYTPSPTLADYDRAIVEVVGELQKQIESWKYGEVDREYGQYFEGFDVAILQVLKLIGDNKK